MIPLALFHITNTQLFDDIGIFPYVMLTSLLLYFDSEELPWWKNAPVGLKSAKESRPQRRGHASSVPEAETAAVAAPRHTPQWIGGLLIVYFIFQVLFPFRGFFLPNPLDYSTIGNRFSWRMKIDTRDPEEVAVFVKRTDNGEERQVKIESYLNPMQIRLLYIDPRAIAHFAEKLRRMGKEKGNTELEVRAKIKLKYNGRSGQYFVPPDREISHESYSPFQKAEWLVPLQE
jgi:hypothetical protein